MWTLNELVKLPGDVSYVPGVQGIVDPGQPYVPAYCSWDYVYLPGPADCVRVYDEDAGEYVWICYGSGGTYQKVYTCYPEQPYIAPTVIQEGQDAQFIYDYRLGWNSGAVGEAAIPDIGVFEFYIYPSSQGVAVGIADLFSSDYQSYAEMELAVIATNGYFSVWHSGEIVTSRRAFSATTAFRIEKTGQKITVFAGKEVIYQATLVADNYRADCSLYAAFDGIFDASIVEYASEAELLAASVGAYLISESSSSAELIGYREQRSTLEVDTGSSAAFGAYLINGTLYSSLHSETASDAALQGTKGAIGTLASETGSSATMDGHRSHDASMTFEPFTLIASEGDYSVCSLEFEAFTLEANAGQIAPTYAVASLQLVGLTMTGHGLTGETSLSSDLQFEPFAMLAADHPYGEAVMSFEPLTLLAFEADELDMALFATSPGFGISATMKEADKNSLIASAPGFAIEAATGSQLDAVSPGFAISGGMTIDGYMTLQEAIGYA